MKLKVLYDLNNIPSTALLSITAEELGFESFSSVFDNDNSAIGNIWYDKENPNLNDFTQLEQALLAINSGLTFEVLEND